MREGAPELTPRQREVLELVGSGLSYGKVALRLGISRETVRVYARQVHAVLNGEYRLLNPRDALQQFFHNDRD